MYSIVKAQQNLPNDMCALLGLMRVFAAGSGLEGVGCVCLWDSVRSVFNMVEDRVGLIDELENLHADRTTVCFEP